MTSSDVETRWIKFGVIEDFVILADHVIMMASGIHVKFLDLVTMEEKIEEFDSPERGKGVSCLAAHPMIPMFGTAEKRSSPKIGIFTYPGIRRVSSCALRRGPNGYLSCTFAGTEYLLSLTNFPEFRIIVWSWRTGENLTSIDTKVTDLSQRLTCSFSSPFQISQLGEISGHLVVYEINVCSRIVMISPTYDRAPSRMTRIVSTSWSADGDLFECDVNGNVILNCNDGKRRYLIVHGEKNGDSESKGIPLIETFRSGIILVDQESRIVFYRKPSSSSSRVKSGTPWKLIWSIEVTHHPMFLVQFHHRDALLINCDGGEMIELMINDDDDAPMIQNIFYQGSKNKFLLPVNPGGDHVAVIDQSNRLNVYQCSTGRFVSTVVLKTYGAVHSSVSHPKLPLLAIGTAAGKLVLINFHEITEPAVVREIHLVRKPLDIIRFSWSSRYLGIIDVTGIQLFVISKKEDDRYSVLGLMDFDFVVIDFLIYEDENDTKLLILAGTSESKKAGKIMVVYSFDDSLSKKCLCAIELTHVLDCLGYGRNIHEIITVPYLTKQLHLMKIQEDYQGLDLVEAFSSGHQLRNIKFSMNDSFVFTYGYDGLIIVRNRTNVHQALTIFMAHHRLDGGVKIAVFSSSNNTIVSLGRNGDLVATTICNVESLGIVGLPDLEELDSWVRSTNYIEDDSTWLEREEMTKLQKERELCAEERSSIMKDFEKLRERLKVLLDANEHEVKNVKLPISEFDLNRDRRERKTNENIARQTKVVEKLESEIFQQDEVSNYVRKLCWDSMEIQACSLVSINGKTKIENFAIPKLSKEEESARRWESFLVDFRFPNGLEETGSEAEPFLIVGTTTDRFLPETSNRTINQIQKCPNYSKSLIIRSSIKDRERKLKIRFNEMFEKMRSAKNRELNMATQRLEEIKHCTIELENLFGTIPKRDPNLVQPSWHFTEKPETILKVTQTEIATGIASTFLEVNDLQEFVIKENEESKKVNDNFRENALQAMMDGLLEVRWEDEIKKDPPKPSFLSTKDPSFYTEEERLEVETFRAKSAELVCAREKYKKMLQEKIIEVEESLRKDFRFFDRSLEALHVDRMRIESAILQESLMRLRESQRHLLRQRGIEKIRLANQEMTLALDDLRKVTLTLTNLENAVTETRNRYENLTKRDKTFDAKFRGEFPDLKQPMVEHLLRHYRKRPRNVKLTSTSITYLTDTARCVINGDTSEILPRECSEYLRGLDALDTMPNNFPPQIDVGHWNLLCRLRRAKIELEIKIKICAVDLAEAEQTYVSYQKSCFSMETKVSQTRESIRDRETKNREILEDMEIQLVLKMGQVECQLYGDPNELCNAVLVPFSLVENANKAIIDAGREKLATMRRTILFRRTTLWREWRHRCMQFTLDNMQERLKILQGVKVTKEVQNYLELQSGGIIDQRTSNDRVLDSTKKRFDRILQETKNRLDDSIRKIEQWRKKNRKITNTVEKIKMANSKTSTIIHDDDHQRDAKHRRIKLKAIMKRTRLKKKIQINYNELLGLQNELELLRLKTYPTLRLKGLPREDRTLKKCN